MPRVSRAKPRARKNTKLFPRSSSSFVSVLTPAHTLHLWLLDIDLDWATWPFVHMSAHLHDHTNHHSFHLWMWETTTKPRKRPQRGDGGKIALWLQCVGEPCLLWHAAPRPEVRVGIIMLDIVDCLDVHFLSMRKTVCVCKRTLNSEMGNIQGCGTLHPDSCLACTPTHHQIYRRETFLAPTKCCLSKWSLDMAGLAVLRGITSNRVSSSITTKGR